MTNIIIDDRESGCGIAEMLRKTPGVSVSMQRLPLGDYLVDQKLLVERKTLKDFASSIMDGRVFHQASGLASHPYRSAIFLEGDLDVLPQIHSRQELIQSALIALTIDFRIPVLRSMNPEERSRLLLYIMSHGRFGRDNGGRFRVRESDHGVKRNSSSTICRGCQELAQNEPPTSWKPLSETSPSSQHNLSNWRRSLT
jgi:ERCC4-type nuclease